MENSADEHSPWAIIIIMAPAVPQVVKVIIPVIKMPMWPIDE